MPVEMLQGQHLRVELNNFKSISQTFGKIDNFKIGDIVYWSKYSEKKIGIVSDLYSLFDGNRKVAYATIFCFEEQRKHNILCMNLKILTKNEFERQKN